MVKLIEEPTTSVYAMNEKPIPRLADISDISYNLQRSVLRRVYTFMYSLSYSSDDREEVWKMLFPNRPMPQTKKGAAKSNFGILNRDIGEKIDEEELEDLLRQSRSA